MFQSKTLDFFLITRFVAAVLVIRQHVDFINPDIIIGPLNLGYFLLGNNGSGGYALVLFIFLTSYLIAKNFFNGKYTLGFDGIKKFYLKRIARIAPLYYFVTLFTLFFVYPYLLEIVHLKIPSYLLKLGNIFTFTYYNNYRLPSWNQVYWALSVEMTFYAVAPLLIWVWQKIATHKYTSLLLLILSLIGTFWFNILYPIDNSFINFLPVMLTGVSLAKLLTFVDISTLNISGKKAGFIGFLFMYIVLCLPWNFLPFKIDWIGIITLASVVFTILIEKYDVKRATDETYKSSPIFGFFNYLGGLSFAMFLIHMLFLIRLNELYRDFLVQHLGGVGGGFAMLGITLLCVIPVSIFLFHAVEEAGAKWFLRTFLPEKKGD